jgi:hypothetical protein
MILAIAPSLVPIGQYAKYMGIMSTVFITASVLGPILGGVISQHSTWRWVFLLKYDLRSSPIHSPTNITITVSLGVPLPS